MPKQYLKQYLILFDSIAATTRCDFTSVIPLYIVVLDDLNARLGGERSILLSYGNILRCYNNTMIAKNQFLNAIWLVLQE